MRAQAVGDLNTARRLALSDRIAEVEAATASGESNATAIAAHSTGIAALGSRADLSEADIENARASLVSLELRVATLEARVRDHESRLAALEGP